MKKVSILIPMYNVEKYIRSTLDSCINQTYQDIEIIVVDDGSSDNSLEIAREYEQLNSNVKVFSQPNSGAPVARNKAFEESTGEYIQYFDADDLLELNKIEIQMNALIKEDSPCCAFGRFSPFFNELDKSNLSFTKRSIDNDYTETKEFLIKLWENFDEILPICWLSHRSVIETAGGWDERLIKHQDGEFFARVALHANKVLFTPESIVYYRRDNLTSLAKNVSHKGYASMLLSYETYMNIMQNDLSRPDVRKSLASVYSLFLYNVYPEYKDLAQKAQEKLNILGFKEPIVPIKKGILPVVLSKIIGFYKARDLIVSTRTFRNNFRKIGKES